MAKKKKKTKGQVQQHQRDQMGKHMESYEKRLFEMLRQLDLDFVKPKFIRFDKAMLYLARASFMRLDDSEAEHLTLNVRKKTLRNYLYKLSKELTVPFVEDENDTRQISIADYYELWVTFSWYIRNRGKDPEATPVHLELRRKLDRYVALNDTSEVGPLMQRIEDGMRGIFRQLALTVSNPLVYYLCFELGEEKQVKGDTRFSHTLHVKTIAPEKKKTVVDKETRRVFTVRVPLGFGTVPLTRALPLASHIKVDPEKEYPIYVMEHAMNRLLERMDCINPLFISFLFNTSVIAGEARWYKNKLLIDFYLFHVKVGYLVGDLVKNEVVIRTFLFLTFNGTPEGDKLNSFTGLQKLDKDYLDIDKLSTFLASKVQADSTIGRLLTKTGCEQLIGLELSEAFLEENAEMRELSDDFMEHYLAGVDREA